MFDLAYESIQVITTNMLKKLRENMFKQLREM